MDTSIDKARCLIVVLSFRGVSQQRCGKVAMCNQYATYNQYAMF